MKWSQETNQQAEAFNRIGNKYEEVFSSNQTQIHAVEWLVQKMPPKASILDVGCGTGFPTAKMLVEAGFNLLGIDISEEMLKIAKQNVPAGNFQLIDIQSDDLGLRKFDGIVAFFCLLMLRKSAIVNAIKKLANQLLPQGYFLFSMVEGDFDYIEIPFLNQKINVSAYPLAELEKIVRDANLNILEVKTVDFTPSGNAPPEKQLFFFCQNITKH